MPLSEKLKAELVTKYAPRFFASAQQREKKLEAERLAAKPKPALVATVSEQLAAKAKANPDKVRISVSGDDNTVVVDRPRRTEVIEVFEVDSEGRPARARRYDALTGEWGTVEFDQGYRQPNGTVSEYDPLAALRRD
jgi:hypothetical protein